MRILFVCNYSLLYGANRSILTIIEYLKNNGYLVLVLLPTSGPMAKELQNLNVPYKIVRFYPGYLYLKLLPKYILAPALILLNIFIFPYLLLICKKFNPHLIYSNTSAENTGVVLSKILGVKHISHIREFMSLDHGSYFIFGRKMKRKFIELSNGVIFVSNAVAKHTLIQNEFSLKHKVVYNGIKTNSSMITFKELPNQIHLGSVGVLQESKGHHLCIEYFSRIFSKYPNMVLHIYGEGYKHYEKSLLLLIKYYNLENSVILHGFVSSQSDIFSNLDALCVFSRAEGFGRVTIEAMMNGVPVIGLDNGGTPELIENNVSGYLFSDFDSFERSFTSLFSSSSNYNMIRTNAFNDANDRFSIENYCSNVEKFIKYTFYEL